MLPGVVVGSIGGGILANPVNAFWWIGNEIWFWNLVSDFLFLQAIRIDWVLTNVVPLPIHASEYYSFLIIKSVANTLGPMLVGITCCGFISHWKMIFLYIPCTFWNKTFLHYTHISGVYLYVAILIRRVISMAIVYLSDPSLHLKVLVSVCP